MTPDREETARRTDRGQVTAGTKETAEIGVDLGRDTVCCDVVGGEHDLLEEDGEKLMRLVDQIRGTEVVFEALHGPEWPAQ